MSDLNQLKTMIDNLQRRQFTVKKQVETFEVLLEQITVLQERAPQDPDAVRKLTKLNEVLTGNNYHTLITTKVAQLKKSFDELGKQLSQLASGDTTMSSPKALPVRANVPKKRCRAFV